MYDVPAYSSISWNPTRQGILGLAQVVTCSAPGPGQSLPVRLFQLWGIHSVPRSILPHSDRSSYWGQHSYDFDYTNMDASALVGDVVGGATRSRVGNIRGFAQNSNLAPSVAPNTSSVARSTGTICGRDYALGTFV